ncbi:MAG: tRNA adenosine(34) deaminase TadA [Nitrospirae bacterium]|nr:tRNA adenosine(34) deaminase TadA [Nitrospirota bacterium]
MTYSDEYFMRLALKEAETAFIEGEVPVGAVLVREDTVIAAVHNVKEALNDPTAHAELIALRQGALAAGSWRLNDATLYVTKEPCIMCAGAMVNARLGKLVYGCKDGRYGAVASRYQIASDPVLNHQVKIISGVLEYECADVLRRFFIKLRGESDEFSF